MTRRARIAVCAAALAAAQGAWSAEPPRVAATVDGQPISAEEVSRMVARSLRGRTVGEAESRRLAARALELVIDRRLILAELAANGLAASETEIDARMETLARSAAARSMTLDALLAEKDFTVEAFRQELAWELGWTAYLKRFIDDEARKRHFAEHHREHDGTLVRASHILFPVEADAPPEAWRAAAARAERVRQEIVSGGLTFAEAARRHSEAPTRDQGGDLGYFPRHDRMVEPLAEAAFALAQGEVSQPITTPFGVHLLTPTGETPGDKDWTDLRAEIDRALAEERFRAAAMKVRAKARIDYTIDFPHIDPRTGEVSPPP